MRTARVLLMAVLLAACGRQDAAPEGLLSREKFTQVLTEAELIEARLNHEMVLEQRLDSPVKRYYAEMFAEQGVTEEEFRRTFDHYTQRPEELRAIWEDVLTELTRRKEEDR